ncbi:vomeronasal type-2 receptor 26-like [Podarcis muralis]
MVCYVHAVKCTRHNPEDVPHEWHQSGDFLISGIVSQLSNPVFSKVSFNQYPPQHPLMNMVTKFYQHILALVFAVDEINENPRILPNVTLGFHIYDSYTDSRRTYRTTLDLLCKSHQFVPNYKCGTQENVIGVIGGLSSDTSSCMADILGLFKIPQVGSEYWSSEAFLSPPP